MQDLTGTWNCQDSLMYYFIQKGNRLYGHGTNGASNNVAIGTIDSAAQRVTIEWADKPDSNGAGNHGVAYLNASNPGQMVKVAGNPQFGIGNFTKE